MDNHQTTESVCIRHEPCPSCGSRDNLGRYSDGHGFCFGCGHYEPGDGSSPSTSHAGRKRMAEGLIEGEFGALPKRGINEDTCRKFGYQKGEFKGKPCQIAPYYNAKGELVAQKIRFADKTFTTVGNMKEATLFGAQLWGKGKKIIITEGEIDALTVSQVQGNKWPVVSIPNGAQGAKKALAKNLEYLNTFEEVILMFDMDEAGKEAAASCVELFPHGKAKVATLPMKDANDCLLANQSDAIIQAIWNAKSYRPDGVLSGEDIWTRLQNRPEVTCYPYPDCMPELQKKTYGIRLGELDTWTSGSGMGKTTVIKQLQHHFLTTTDLNQAIIHLEEPLEDTAEGMLGMHMQKRIGLPDVRKDIPQEELRKAFDETFGLTDKDGNPRLNLYDAFGSMEEQSLYAKIRFLAQGLNCKLIWLDHLSILVSDMGMDGDERRMIDSIMHNLKSLTVELGIYIGLIVHLKKANGSTSFEEGAVPSLDDLRGSGGIKQLSNSVFALSRNQQADGEVARNTSLLTVLKCRFTGRTGPADWLFFNDETGRMELGHDPENPTFGDETDGGLDDDPPF